MKFGVEMKRGKSGKYGLFELSPFLLRCLSKTTTTIGVISIVTVFYSLLVKEKITEFQKNSAY